jgi:transcriptional regulator with XRE-family HTH domain
VSFQSVSKWERGDCFPDITLLPGLANYFGVSIDGLLGMDKIRNKEMINSVFKTVHELEADGKYNEAINLLRENIKIFPDYYSYHSELALALTQISATGDDDNVLKKESIALSEKVLANSTNEKVRSTTRTNLVYLLYNAGERQKASFDHLCDLLHQLRART